MKSAKPTIKLFKFKIEQNDKFLSVGPKQELFFLNQLLRRVFNIILIFSISKAPKSNIKTKKIISKKNVQDGQKKRESITGLYWQISFDNQYWFKF